MITPTRLETAMARALELAARGPEFDANPRVGCVLLSPEGEILAEGWHRGAGTPHAEVDALSRLGERDARGATAVVTLEPCNHTGRTGPCARALIEAGVASVRYAVPDPGPVSGRGAQTLLEAGIDAAPGPLRAEGEALLARWLPAARLGRPRVTLKWASSLDGRAAAADGTSQWITGPAARADVHVRRSEHDAIAVGTGTVLADNPSLTARDDTDLYPRQPIPVVFGHRAVPQDALLREHPQELITLSGDDLRADLAELYARGIGSLFIEGGPVLAAAFIREGLVDNLVIYLAPTLLGGPGLALNNLGVATISEQRPLIIDSVDVVGADIRILARPEADR